MLIVTDEDEKWLKEHLKVLLFYYRNHARMHRGNKLGEAHTAMLLNLMELVKRMEGLPNEKN
jgi:hypothetical protein